MQHRGAEVQLKQQWRKTCGPGNSGCDSRDNNGGSNGKDGRDNMEAGGGDGKDKDYFRGNGGKEGRDNVEAEATAMAEA